MNENLPTIKVLPPHHDHDRGYEIVIDGPKIVHQVFKFEDAVSFLRDETYNAAQVVNGPEVYIITWGPLLAPWEGEPG